MNERWKQVAVDYSRYSVSNFGRVRNDITGRLLKPQKVSKNSVYRAVCLYKDNNKRKWFNVHRLVLLTFRPHKNSAVLDVDHRNFDRSDNRLTNLRWLTRKQNINYSINAGRWHAYGNAAKLTIEQAQEIRALATSTPTLYQRDIGKRYGVSQGAVSQILAYKSYYKL